MRALLAPLSELGEYEEIRELLARRKVSVALSGCADSQKLHMIYGLSQGFRLKLIVTFNDLRAKELYEDYQFYDRNVMLYPAKDLIFFQADIHGNQLTRERIKVFRRLAEKTPLTVITTYDALMAPQVPMQNWQEHVISINRESVVSESGLAVLLAGLGYERCDQVEAPGQFSIRGGIVDIFDLTEENPYRIELWGDEVESIRSFDVLSQRSIEKLESLCIYPATELILSKDGLAEGLKKIQKEGKKQAETLRKQMKTEEAHRVETQMRELTETLVELGVSYNTVNLESYVRYFYPELKSFAECFAGEESCVFLDEPIRIKEHVDAVELEFRESMAHRAEKGYILPGQMDVLFSASSVAAGLENMRLLNLSAMEGKNPLVKAEQKFAVQARSLPSYNNSFDALVKDLKAYKKKGYRILLLSGSRTRAKRLAEDLREQEISAFYTEDPMREVQPEEVMTGYGRVRKGFEYPLLQFMVIAESDIFGAQKKKKRKKKRYEGQKINDFNDLRVGDYVVHESHGLGVYQGIEKVEVDHVVKDYMKISYRDGGILYVLATGLDVIQKYASADGGTKPKLNKLGTQEWTRTKSKVRTAVEEIAGDLVELYAARQEGKGYCYGQDTVWQREFEEMFPFEETEDQTTAIAATKNDMESEKIMDRLICGDVG
ncbi:MAG: transcription-repair coupling factor, partial [Lachnospiraceae bacterium]|nr:transcription-repair coupling factor [Lachnospiraceae bacterium]